jgi:alpha-glucosidase
MKKMYSAKYLFTVFCIILLFPSLVLAAVKRLKFQADGNYLVVEALEDDLFHFEYGTGVGPDTSVSIENTDMVCSGSDNVPPGVCKIEFKGPTQFGDNQRGTLQTKDVRLLINTSKLLVTVTDKTKNNVQLTTIGPLKFRQGTKGLMLTRSGQLDVYGLGEQFVEPGKSDINWDGRVREGGEFGNVMAPFNGGNNGNTQFPIMYAVNGATNENYALFLDNKYKQKWDFTGQSRWKVEIFNDPTSQIRFYFMTGSDLMDLRKHYMNLTGHPLVPPKKMFGLWVSEYGYDNWNELEDKLATLRNNNFPVDGFVLDLQWFGGIPSVTGKCRMGSLDFDETTFPDPKGKIGNLKESNGIGIMLIEEAYVCKDLPEHGRLQNYGCLVKNRPGDTQPAFLSGFWGSGGMIDYTDDNCSRFEYDSKRQQLIDKGVIGHWTDLGEPEIFSPQSGYSVGTHADAHNIFNFRWIRGIYQGYLRHNERQRPFIMSRSGTAGIQRFGAAMWSGDIASRLSSLAAQAANQMHMSFSGIDYYGADIGGFRREQLDSDLDEMYTQWYANGMMFDIPGRPHTDNSACIFPQCTTPKKTETAPDRIGNLISNLENTRQRYELIPYVYSLAHRAYLTGEPVMPPLVVYYQTDNNVRGMGNEKMIGRDLLAAIVAKPGETERDVYLPAGVWFDWHTNRRIDSTGVSIRKVPEFRNGLFRLPLYAREGAIIPLAFVDDKTMNAVGKRKDGSIDNGLIARIFAFVKAGSVNSFTLYEDDGATIAYQKGEVRVTEISQARKGNDLTVEVHKSQGTYRGAPTSRNNVIELVAEGSVKKVNLNGNELSKFTNLPDFNRESSGWINLGNNTVLAKSGDTSVSNVKTFVFTMEPVSR